MALYSCRRLLRKVPSDIGKPSKIPYLKQLRKNCFECSELHLGKIQRHSPGSVFLWILVRLDLLSIMFYGESYFAFFIWVIFVTRHDRVSRSCLVETFPFYI